MARVTGSSARMQETAAFLARDSDADKKPGHGPRGTLRAAVKKQIRRSFSKKALFTRLPVLRWMSNYSASFFVSDMVAGLTVGLTAIPQGIAYAVVAGLEPQYGLYSGFMGCFVYFLLGSVKDITIGPTAIMALMAQKSVESFNSDLAVLLCFLTGCIVLLLGVLHLGFLVSFISVPVTVGFTSAAAITIASSQVKGLLGIKGKSNDFLQAWASVFRHIRETRYEDLSLGLLTIALLVLTKKANERVARRLKGQSDAGRWQKVYAGGWRVVALGRNAIAVVAGALAAYAFEAHGMQPFRLTGEVKGELPQFGPPPFWTTVTEGNGTRVVEFGEMVSSLGTGMLSVPLISVLETIAIAKAFAKGRSLDATQEMIALGASNVAGSFFRSMPTAGSFTRTAVNNASGVRTPLGGLFTGAVVLLALKLSATFKYIPKATLAAVIMTAMFYMLELHEMKLIWRIRKLDLLPLSATILASLTLGLDYGIITGVSVNLLFLLHAAVRPTIAQHEPPLSDVLLIRPQQTLAYPAAEYLRESVLKASSAKPNALLVLDGSTLHALDTTLAKNLKTLAEDLHTRAQPFVFWNWTPASRAACLRLDPALHDHFRSSPTLQDLLPPPSGPSAPTE